ncbi:hypothetical protein BGZ63DRAFT_429245 [Mariannaea sp. PMI_226]|nr:hypothetical protein BGZ63DRAFT_429245 [Mariannaea sp. PMI_226]
MGTYHSILPSYPSNHNSYCNSSSSYNSNLPFSDQPFGTQSFGIPSYDIEHPPVGAPRSSFIQLLPTSDEKAQALAANKYHNAIRQIEASNKLPWAYFHLSKTSFDTMDRMSKLLDTLFRIEQKFMTNRSPIPSFMDYNYDAREANRTAWLPDHTLIPLRDLRGQVIKGCPKMVRELLEVSDEDCNWLLDRIGFEVYGTTVEKRHRLKLAFGIIMTSIVEDSLGVLSRKGM